MADFSPELIFFDEEGYKHETDIAQAKLKALDSAMVHCEQYVSVTNLKAFEGDIIDHFKSLILDTYKEFIKLGVSVEKIIDLKDIDIRTLQELAETYYSLKGEITWSDDNSASIVVNKRPYQKFTKNEEQNKALKTIQNFISAVENLQAINNGIRIGTIALASGGSVIGDMRTNSLKVNTIMFS